MIGFNFYLLIKKEISIFTSFSASFCISPPKYRHIVTEHLFHIQVYFLRDNTPTYSFLLNSYFIQQKKKKLKNTICFPFYPSPISSTSDACTNVVATAITPSMFTTTLLSWRTRTNTPSTPSKMPPVIRTRVPWERFSSVGSR